ncbi:MAG: hypothetical protein QW228_06005 [Candidatus Aenigmatarchaeota archaeon]
MKLDFQKNFDALVKEVKSRVRKKYDAVIGITGEEGVGKSTFAIQLGKALDENFDFERNIVFNPDKDKIKKLIIELPKYSVVDVDEAIKVLYKLQWYSEIQHLLNIVYAICRRENKISLLLMPRFKDFNEYFRNHRIKIWIHVIDRGIALIFKKDWSPFIKDPWRMDENQKLLDEIYKSKKDEYINFSITEKISILKSLPNFVAPVTFPPLTHEEEKLFEELREKSGIYEEEVTVSRFEKKWKERFAKLCYYLHEKEGKQYVWIAERIDCDPQIIRSAVMDYSKTLKEETKRLD